MKIGCTGELQKLTEVFPNRTLTVTRTLTPPRPPIDSCLNWNESAQLHCSIFIRYIPQCCAV